MNNIFKYLPPIAQTVLSNAELRNAADAGAWAQHGREARKFQRYAPAFIDDPDGNAIFSDFGADTYISPPPLVSSIPNAMLTGYRALLWQQSFCLDEAGLDPSENRDAVAKLWSSDPFLNEDTGFLASQAVDSVSFATGIRPTRHIPGAALVLCSHEPSNYGSFLFRVMPKLATIRALSLNDLPVIVYARTQSVLDLLEICGVDIRRVIQHEIGFETSMDRAIVPTLRNPHGFLDGETVALIRAMVASVAPDRPTRKLYVSRLRHGQASGSTRRLVNEVEVAERLAKLGFEILEPERLSMREQIKTFAEAAIVVGPSGSGMFNTVFCTPGTRIVDIESEPHWIYAHAGLFASCELDYGLFVGTPDPTDSLPVHRRWTLNVDGLADRIASLI